MLYVLHISKTSLCLCSYLLWVGIKNKVVRWLKLWMTVVLVLVGITLTLGAANIYFAVAFESDKKFTGLDTVRMVNVQLELMYRYSYPLTRTTVSARYVFTGYSKTSSHLCWDPSVCNSR